MRRLQQFWTNIRQLWLGKFGPRSLEIQSFYITPNKGRTIPPTYQLSWRVFGAERVSVYPTWENTTSKGEKKIALFNEDQTFKLTAIGKDGNAISKELHIKKVFIHKFEVSNPIVPEGHDLHLEWDTENASEVFISGLGHFPAFGTIRVKASQKQSSYTLFALGEGTWIKRTVSVVVQPLPLFEYDNLSVAPMVNLDAPQFSIKNPLQEKNHYFYQIFSDIKSVKMMTGNEIPQIEAEKLKIYAQMAKLKTKLQVPIMFSRLGEVFSKLRMNIENKQTNQK